MLMTTIKTRIAAAGLMLAAALLPRVAGETPERLDQPERTRATIKRLAEQDSWKAHATPQQIRLFDGPETGWPVVPEGQYDLSGFDRSILGGKVPPPGVHPRVLFNQEDVPVLRRRIMATADGQREWALTEHILTRTMLDPARPDGLVFAKLAEGRLDGLTFVDVEKSPNGGHQFVGFAGEIHPAHVCYWPRNLAALAFFALLQGDEALSRKVAAATCNYYRLREPLIDAQNARGSDPNADGARPLDVWRGMHHVAGEAHLGMAYDLAARYMNEEQRRLLRRIIAKATAGKRSYGANGPIRWRDTNWVGWDTQHFICHLAIEGEEGYDPAIIQVARDTIYGYLTYGISPYGTIFETNGKNGAGLHFALISAVALARRGDNLLGHPHLRKMSVSQVHQVVPAGGRNVNNGTYGCGDFGNAGFLKNLYPQDQAADWLIQAGRPLDEEARAFDLQAYKAKLASNAINWKRLHPLTANGIFEFAAYAGPPNAGEQRADTWARAYLGLPLDLEDPHHGQLCTRSSNARDALFLMMEARPDLYSVGHQHHDAGHFYLSADGIDWGVENDRGMATSAVHSMVMIDGKGQGDTQHCKPTRVRWLGAVLNEHAAIARSDLKHAYDYIWSTPMHYSWNHEERRRFEWEPETDPEVVAIFKGTQNWKGRIWAHSYWDNDWGPTMRAKYNPVDFAFRTAGIVRGGSAPGNDDRAYAVVVDDIKKAAGEAATPAREHLYEWVMQVPAGARLLPRSDGRIVLAMGDQRRTGEPLLLVEPIAAAPGRIESRLDSYSLTDKRSTPVNGKRLVLATRGAEARFRVLLIPVRAGGAMPALAVRPDRQGVSLQWTRQTDAMTFTPGADGRTRFNVVRNGVELVRVD